MRGLLIAEPWMSRILEGRKTWEMRREVCRQRGTIALIRSGSGLIVGTAEVVDSLPPLATREEYATAEPYHAIRPEEQAAAFDAGWRTPWVLANACPVAKPVPYKHPSGAMKWVILDDAVAAAISAQTGRSKPTPATTPVPAPRVASSAPAAGTHDTRTIRLTGGNIRWHHIYLPLDFFPADAIGGRNRHETAPRTITVTFHPGETVETDIDRSKRILRARGPVREFLARAAQREGDSVRIERTAPYSFLFSKAAE